MTPSLRLDVPRFLARLPLFATIDEATLGRLAAHCELRRLDQGALIFQAGDPADAFFVVVGGQIRLFVAAPNGQEKVVQIFGPRQSFAKAVMFLGVQPTPTRISPRRASVYADYTGTQLLPSATTGAPSVWAPAYTMVGAQVTRPLPYGLEASLGVINLTDVYLVEKSPLFPQAEMPRTWRLALRGRW